MDKYGLDAKVVFEVVCLLLYLFGAFILSLVLVVMMRHCDIISVSDGIARCYFIKVSP